MWQLVAMVIISLIVSDFMRPSVNQKAPQMQRDINFPQVDEGTPQAVIFGDCWSGDWTILAVGDYRTEAIMQSGGGGK